MLLRKEPRPLEWDELYEPQQDVFLQMLGGLQEALRELGGESDQRKRDIYIDPRNSSRLLFITGDPETGKTTLLINMIDQLTKRERWTSNGSASSKKKLEEANNAIKELRSRVIWLEPLNMEYLPRPMNFLVNLLVRLENAINVYCKPTSLQFKSEGLLPRLKRLQRSVSIGWDGNVKERASQLDPDAYAYEVVDAEHSRLDIRKELSDILQEAASLYHTQSGAGDNDDVIFVLSIDDYDLNPAQCIELIRLLRKVSVPRLFLLFFGDLHIVENILMLNMGRQLYLKEAPLLQKGMPLEGLGADLAKTTRNVAQGNLHRLIPPQQRIELRKHK